MKKLRNSAFVTAAVVAMMMVTCGSLRTDELLCEEALAKIKECCPGFNTTPYACEYVEGCGSDRGRKPEISETESECLRGSSCENLRSNNLCDRANVYFESNSSDPTKARRSLCP